ncbi:TauD/TfdA family dioxygenase [Dactylosporangium sp. CA-092794]|uniref:TauD/TfdA family dioxygenase n=1 Tax=Dactylosporangium sp. CA-092794 TaxID=3239929 RepID=UPI003D909968
MPTTDAVATIDLDITHETGKPPILRTPAFDSLDAAIAWVSEQREAIRAELHRSGSLMIRGVGVRDAGDFARVRDVLLPRRASYKEKATPRTDFGEGVFSSTDLPAVQPIRLHNENSYTLDFPTVLLFGCVIAPESGGATTVGDMRRALELIPAGLRERFATAGWLLVRNFSELAGLPWHKSFATEDPAQVEAYCRENVIGYEWLSEGELRTRQRRSAIVTHPVTGERTWFNHVAFWSRWSLDPDVRDVLLDTYGEDGLPFETYVGDGTPLTEAEAGALNAVYDQVTLRETWQEGDLLLVDNILSAHGREAYHGDRKILVAMGDPIALADCDPATEPSTTVYGK